MMPCTCIFTAKPGDACGEQPNQRACENMDNAECGDSKECECVENYEDVNDLCQCPVDMTEFLAGEEGAGEDPDAPGCRTGMFYSITSKVALLPQLVTPSTIFLAPVIPDVLNFCDCL